MVSIKRVNFGFEEAYGKGLISVTFRVTGLTKLDKGVLKWQLKDQIDVVFDGPCRLELKCTKFIKSEVVSDLIKEIAKYVEEKKKKIKKVLEDAAELRSFLNAVSDEDIEEAE